MIDNDVSTDVSKLLQGQINLTNGECDIGNPYSARESCMNRNNLIVKPGYYNCIIYTGADKTIKAMSILHESISTIPEYDSHEWFFSQSNLLIDERCGFFKYNSGDYFEFSDIGVIKEDAFIVETGHLSEVYLFPMYFLLDWWKDLSVIGVEILFNSESII